MKRENTAGTVAIPQLLLVDNSSVIKIVVQIQIRLGNSARTVALRRATAKFQISALTSVLFFYLSARSNSLESR